MELMTIKAVNERFTALRKLALAGEDLPEDYRDSAADVEGYEACCGIFRDMRARSIGKAELQARGNIARARYVERKRAELLDVCVYQRALEAQKRASVLGARLRKTWEGTPEGMIDAVCDFIAALEGTDVGAKGIRRNMRKVLLTSSSTEKKETAPSVTPDGATAPPKGAPHKVAPAAHQIPPTLDEVRAYFREKRFKSDPEEFFAYYEGSDWVRSRGVKIKDWHAAARTWEIKDAKFTPKQRARKEQVFSSDASYDLEEYAKTAVGLGVSA